MSRTCPWVSRTLPDPQTTGVALHFRRIFNMIGGYKTLLVLVLSCIVVPVLRATTQAPNNFGNTDSFPGGQKRKQEFIGAFEASLLKLFGLSSRPQSSNLKKIPQYLVDLYKSHTKYPDAVSRSFNVKGKGLSTANTVRSFYHNDISHLKDCEENSCLRIWFDISSIPADEVLTAAEMLLYVENSAGDRNKTIKYSVEVHEIMNSPRKSSEVFSRLIDIRHIKVRNATWESFDVHPAVLKWRKTPKRNHGLEIRILPYNSQPSRSPMKHVRLRRSADMDENAWHSQRPLLMTYTDDGRGKRADRTRRGARRKNRRNRKKNRRRKGNKDQCRRHSLYVDFNGVGWNDWIVAPPGYMAYYCHGLCPFPLADQLNTTNHAIVQTLVNSVNPRAVPTPCCVPTELSPISMLYLDEYGKVVLKNYQDMVVEGCGCR